MSVNRFFDLEVTTTMEDTISSVTFLLGMVTTTAFNGIIVYKLSSRDIASTSTQTITTRNQVARMIVITGCIFFLCQLPYRIYSALRLLDRFTNFVLPPKIMLGLALTGFGTHLNAVLNAALYPIVNPFYRRAYREAFTFRCPATSKPKEKETK